MYRLVHENIYIIIGKVDLYLSAKLGKIRTCHMNLGEFLCDVKFLSIPTFKHYNDMFSQLHL